MATFRPIRSIAHPTSTMATRTAGESPGPIVGMVSGMRLHPDADWLVVACDLPRLDLPTLTHLVASVSRVYGGFLLAAAVALPLGLMIGRFTVMRSARGAV